jgi:hypothetical protein
VEEVARDNVEVFRVEVHHFFEFLDA